ncbi:MAG: MATE family efflux transporter [Lachnospiraceae bacterium]|nr:MATE family efflux transporter [Lachnospiraceae bacterium]
MNKHFCTDKDFFKNYFRLAVWLIIQQAIVLSVNLLDNIMIGSYSENALAGVTIINQIHFVYQGLLDGLVTGMVVLGSQYWGKKDGESIKKLAPTGFYLALAFSLLMFLIAAIVPNGLVGLFTKDPEVITQALEYLNVIKWSWLFFAVTMFLLATMRGIGSASIAVIVSVISLFVNAGGNYILIFGHFGAPELGSAGAALATTTARVLEMFIVAFYVFRLDKKLCLKIKDVFTPHFENIGRYMGVAAPILIAEGSFCCGNAAQSVVLGNLSTTALAANSISTSLYQLVKVMAIGASNAAAVCMGQVVPRGKEYAVKCANSLQIIFIAVGIVVAAVLYILRIPILNMYNVSPETRELADQFIKLLCIIGFCMSYQMSCNCGITRGGGDPRFVMYVDLICIWLIVIPLSFLAAFKFNWSPIAIMLCLNIDQIIKIIPASIKVNSHTWYRDLTVEKENEEKR